MFKNKLILSALVFLGALQAANAGQVKFYNCSLERKIFEGDNKPKKIDCGDLTIQTGSDEEMSLTQVKSALCENISVESLYTIYVDFGNLTGQSIYLRNGDSMSILNFGTDGKYINPSPKQFILMNVAKGEAGVVTLKCDQITQSNSQADSKGNGSVGSSRNNSRSQDSATSTQAGAQTGNKRKTVVYGTSWGQVTMNCDMLKGKIVGVIEWLPGQNMYRAECEH